MVNNEASSSGGQLAQLEVKLLWFSNCDRCKTIMQHNIIRLLLRGHSLWWKWQHYGIYQSILTTQHTDYNNTILYVHYSTSWSSISRVWLTVVTFLSISVGAFFWETVSFNTFLENMSRKTLTNDDQINPISEGGAHCAPPLRNIALNQVIWAPGPPKLKDFS